DRRHLAGAVVGETGAVAQRVDDPRPPPARVPDDRRPPPQRVGDHPGPAIGVVTERVLPPVASTTDASACVRLLSVVWVNVVRFPSGSCTPRGRPEPQPPDARAPVGRIPTARLFPPSYSRVVRLPRGSSTAACPGLEV